ncbi:MAG: cytoplasmic protein [Candidatus Atribacteria bacterium]|nr:cytoplasmic protein [Candidatus Atribacteria bacterium]
MGNEMIKVLLVGETWIVLKFHVKGFDVVPLGGYEDFSRWFREALKAYPDVEVIHMPNHVALSAFPHTVDELKTYDVVILSDTGCNTLTFYPDFFQVPMGPDKLSVVREFVEQGGGLVMCGGWMSFQGVRAIANYHGSAIEEVSPVSLLRDDDRVETTAGVKPAVLLPEHPVVRGIPPQEWPLFLGYNRLQLKGGAICVASCGEDTFIAVWEYGKGRTMAFASDLAPHWGNAFVEWKYYAQFWYQTIKWLAKKME